MRPGACPESIFGYAAVTAGEWEMGTFLVS
jgi:hypothetical protein